jgi:hypothetical protein
VYMSKFILIYGLLGVIRYLFVSFREHFIFLTVYIGIIL